MKSSPNTSSFDIPALIPDLGKALKLSIQDIIGKYANVPTCVIEYTEKDYCKKIIEVRLPDENISMLFSFNTEDRCHFIYLFPNIGNKVKEVIAYLNLTFNPCQQIPQTWICSDFSVSLREDPQNIYFLFYIEQQ